MEGNWNGSFAEAKNKYQYNGIEMNNDFGLDLNMAFYRGYDAAVGRWWQIDPKPNLSESSYSAMGNNPIRYSDMLGDTVRGVDAQSAQRAQGIIVTTFAKKIAGGMGFASLIKLGKDGKTLQSIGKRDFDNATKNLSKDAKALATGYYNAINDNRMHRVEVVKRGEPLSQGATEISGDKTGSTFDDNTHGGLSRPYAANAFENPEKGDLSVIVMDSKYATAEELSSHEILGHAGNGANGIGNYENGVNAVQATNVYRRAVGISTERVLGGGHGDPNQIENDPSYRQRSNNYPPNMSYPNN
jgi:RHS repeat-associated protein